MRYLSSKKFLLSVIGISLSVLFLWLAVRDIRFADVWQTIRYSNNVLMLFSGFLCYMLFFIFKTLRWHYLLLSKVNISSINLIPYVMLGYAGNILLPFQAGEITRAVMLSRRYPIATFTAISTIALEKIFDFLWVLIFFACALASVDLSSPLLNSTAEIVSYLLAVTVILILLPLLYPAHTDALIKVIFGLLPDNTAVANIEKWLTDTIAGFMVLRDGTVFLKIAVTSFLAWISMLTSLFLVIGALNIDTSLATAAIVLFLSAVGLSIPTGPGFIGTIQIAFVAGMVPFGVHQVDAVAASLLYNLMITVLPLIVGCLCFINLGFSLKELCNNKPERK